MPRLSVWLLRLSFGCLVIGAAVGAWRLGLGQPDDSSRYGLRALHRLLLLEGWLLPFVVGTAHWMLPKHAGAAPRGDERPGLTAFAVYVSGLSVGALALLPGLPAGLGLVAATLRLLGLALLLRLLWPRIKPFGTGRPQAPSPMPRL